VKYAVLTANGSCIEIANIRPGTDYYKEPVMIVEVRNLEELNYYMIRIADRSANVVI